MNCSTHTDVPAVAFCRSCGRALCADCRHTADGTVYCAEHAPAASTAAGPRYSPSSTTPHANPGIAFLLGFIPGVGAIYNGQYAKGLVHAVIFGLMISILSSQAIPGLEPLFGILLGVFVLYMPFEAYHTARRRNNGEQVEEFSSLFHSAGGHSTGAMALIIVGSIFLLNTLGIVEMHQIMRFWPVLLIAVGVNMLHSRISSAGRNTASGADPNREVNHERQ